MNRDQARQAFMECISILYNWGNTAHMLGLAASESPYEQTDKAKEYEALMKRRALELLAMAFPADLTVLGQDYNGRDVCVGKRAGVLLGSWLPATVLGARDRGLSKRLFVVRVDGRTTDDEVEPHHLIVGHPCAVTDEDMREAQQQLAERPCTATSSPRTVPAGTSWVNADGHPLCMGPDRLDPRSAGHHEAWTAAERLIWKCARIEAKDYPRERGTDALELVLEMFAEARSALQQNIEALLSGSDALLVPEESAPNLGSSTHTDAAMREAQRQLAERPCTATSSPRTVPAGNSWVDADGHPLRVGQRVRIATGQEGTVVTLGGRHPDEVAVRFAGCIHDSHFEPSGLLVVHEAPPSRESSPVNPELHTVAGRQRLAELARDVLDACERPGGDHWATAEGIQRMFVRARKLAEFILEEKR